MACRTVLGDRNLSVTQKRYQAKMHLIELYKEQYENAISITKDLKSEPKASKTTVPPTPKVSAKANLNPMSGKGSIFDLSEDIQKPP